MRMGVIILNGRTESNRKFSSQFRWRIESNRYTFLEIQYIVLILIYTRYMDGTIRKYHLRFLIDFCSLIIDYIIGSTF